MLQGRARPLQAVFADTIAYEAFDYSSTKSNGDKIDTANGGSGWAGAWTGPANRWLSLVGPELLVRIAPGGNRVMSRDEAKWYGLISNDFTLT